MSTPRPKGHRPAYTQPSWKLRYDNATPGESRLGLGSSVALGQIRVADVVVETRGNQTHVSQPGDIVKSLQGVRFVR